MGVRSKRVILPEENKKDLEEVPQQVKKELQLIFVDSIDKALEWP
jgi:ATP-dependent Lon protease